MIEKHIALPIAHNISIPNHFSATTRYSKRIDLVVGSV
jgi:hypothetical protein